MKRIRVKSLFKILNPNIFLAVAIALLLFMPWLELNHLEDMQLLFPKLAFLSLVLVIITSFMQLLINEKV